MLQDKKSAPADRGVSSGSVITVTGEVSSDPKFFEEFIKNYGPLPDHAGTSLALGRGELSMPPATPIGEPRSELVEAMNRSLGEKS